MTEDPIQQRKKDHLMIIMEKEVAYERGTLLDGVQLIPNALPELALDEIDTSCEFFDKPLKAPLMITSMTGGGDRSGAMNHELAEAAGQLGIAFSVGSQRVLLEHPDCLPDFAVRKELGDGVLLGNIGAQQLTQYPAKRISELVEMIEADGMCVHLNPAHELAQAAGDRDFNGQLKAIAALVKHLDGRVLVKETGCGIAPLVARRLSDVGVRYIDVAGVGGTSWPKVERHRKGKLLSKAIAWTFGEWGMPTAPCVVGARRACGPETYIIAAGGIITGLDIARAIACGADLAGCARLLASRSWWGGKELDEEIQTLIHELKTAMLLTGCRDLVALRQTARVYTGELRHWLAQLDQLATSKD